LVNLSKEDEGRRTWWERIYTSLPPLWVPYLFGGCRPVLMEGLVREAGFWEVRREYLHRFIPSEIVTAKKPRG
ncbi:MAG: hypothetical protein ACE5KY_03270, partial [Candidatus Tectimicrobiota bacterium]